VFEAGNVISENNTQGKGIYVRKVKLIILTAFQFHQLFLLCDIVIDHGLGDALRMVHHGAPIVELNGQQVLDVVSLMTLVLHVAVFANVHPLVHAVENGLLVLVVEAHILEFGIVLFGRSLRLVESVNPLNGGTARELRSLDRWDRDGLFTGDGDDLLGWRHRLHGDQLFLGERGSVLGLIA
jgi:hypothetical protein